ncbi:MAG: ribonuclease HII [Ruminococcaceae bacterium]|nr:ribonuclease HII [Oscillospiraceae bacterium]
MAKQPSDPRRLYQFDAEWRAEAPRLCGVDEAGRGPLCGPVAVAAVILDPDTLLEGLDDSKKLNEARREALYQRITETAIAWQVVLVPPRQIDELNILQATLLGMRLAVEGLATTPDCVLVDGDKTPRLPQRCVAVTKGDAQSACIAAASVLAKVTRDRHMVELDKQYPQYALAQHKGYPTKLHYELLEQHGLQPFYRKSFLKKRGLA